MDKDNDKRITNYDEFRKNVLFGEVEAQRNRLSAIESRIHGLKDEKDNLSKLLQEANYDWEEQLVRLKAAEEAYGKYAGEKPSQDQIKKAINAARVTPVYDVKPFGAGYEITCLICKGKQGFHLDVGCPNINAIPPQYVKSNERE